MAFRYCDMYYYHKVNAKHNITTQLQHKIIDI